ncbi:hypothetical protein FRC17_004159 [Serendipita sp. 399]|nr:hypothetical protein FRC17_004159 [Serendipita sp. 399]
MRELDGLFHRTELIPAWGAYCRQWPCRCTLSGRAECSPTLSRLPDELSSEEAKLPVHTNDLRIFRLLDEERDPTQLLRANTNLEALWIPYHRFSVAYEPIWVTHLSHLHLDNVIDDGNVYTLELPQLAYLRARMHLQWQPDQTEYIYPLYIVMPRVTTVHIEGKVFNMYLEGVNKMIFDAKNTLVNLIISHYNCDMFPWERIDEFPRLETFGFDPTQLWRPMSTKFSLHPLPSSLSCSFVIQGIESHSRSDMWGSCNKVRYNFVDTLLRPGKWVGKVVVPFIWGEMESLYVNAFHAEVAYDQPEGPLPCCWPCLEYMDNRNILIEDRNGMSLRKGDGAAFARRMKTFKHKLGPFELME